MGGGDGLRGRVLVIDGGSGRAARRFPPREGRPAPGLTRILAAIAPQVLLAADGVDTVLLPSAVDADTIRDHLRAAARHPGPLLVHIGGHLVRDRRTGALDVELDQERLPWRTLEEELRLRPMQFGTLVIGDLSAEAEALPQLRVLPSPLGVGLPLWASVSPDPQQVGTFTRALVEALHGGRPGAGERLTPEQLQQQVHTVLRPETQIVISHAPGWQVFRNTSRRLGPTLVDAQLPSADQTAQLPAFTPDGFMAPAVPAVPAAPATPDTTGLFGAPVVPQQSAPAPAPTAAPVRAASPASAVGQRSPETVTVELPMPSASVATTPAYPSDLPRDIAPFDMPPLPTHAPTVHLTDVQRPTPDDIAPYREAISAIVAAADAGEHARAVRESIALERTAVTAHGTDSEPVLKLRQVRAHVTRLAGLQREAALLYRDVALSLLDGRGADDPETRQAAANAEACWRAIEDDADARRLGPDILRLRQALPDARRVAAVERHLARLRGEPLPSPASAPEDTPPLVAPPAAEEELEQSPEETSEDREAVEEPLSVMDRHLARLRGEDGGEAEAAPTDITDADPGDESAQDESVEDDEPADVADGRENVEMSQGS
jgi:hypothetical protein